MAQVLDPAEYIFQGFWQNLGKDSTHSLTLTLQPAYATILTNALALFVAMSGGQLWTIIRFTLHQIRASSRAEAFDMAHNQQQIVLRNATTDVATARLMLNLGWASRENARRAITTCVTIAILAILNAALFMAAGTFSNKWIDAGQEVLARSPHCGTFNNAYFNIVSNGPNPTSESDFQLSVEFLAKVIRDVQQSLEVAQVCYMMQPSQDWGATCNSLQAPRLYWTTLANASCPFGTEVCSDNSETIVLDTGMINTYDDLGINAQPGDRLGYRRVTTCTALNDTGHTTGWIQQNDTSLKAFANYGSNLLWETDCTYSFSNFADFFTDFTGVGVTPYQLSSQVAFGPGTAPNMANAGSSSFQPISALTPSDADTSLFFLSFNGKYTAEVKDPWFSAGKEYHRDSPLSLVATNFERDRPISTLGCTEQHQICAGEGRCTTLQGLNQIQETLGAHFKLTPNQDVTLDRLVKAIGVSALSFVANTLARSRTPLLAVNLTATETSTLSLPVPDDQWQLEVGYWHAVAMAQLQRTLIEYGTGQISPQVKYLVPATGADKVFCRNIMVRSTLYSSFNVVTLALIIFFGGAIILLSLTIETVSRWLQLRWNRGSHGRQMWEDHDMLGFQSKRRKGASFPSPNGSLGSMPMGQQHIFDQGVQMGIMSPNVSRHYPSGFANTSPDRASSQALSASDQTRQFPVPSIRSNPSPVRSAITADFCFDFGYQKSTVPSTRSDGTETGEKPLPEVPNEKKEFCIDRGTTDADRLSPGSAKCSEKPGNVARPVDEQVVTPQPPDYQTDGGNIPASGPGRWAYYSAHKRRYGPKLTVLSPNVATSSPPHLRAPDRPHIRTSNTPNLAVPSAPHIAMSSPAGLRGRFGDRFHGDWI